MTTATSRMILVGLLVGCASPAPRPGGRIVTTITVDWEGAYVSPEALTKLGELRASLGGVPFTHFVSAGYFTRGSPPPELVTYLSEQVTAGDEIANHLHAWSSLARAAGLEPKPSPSFLTGTDKVIELEQGETGFDTDLDAYDASGLRSMMEVSQQKLEAAGLTVSKSFRSGGYLTSAAVRHAMRAQGYTVDSSAIDFRELKSAGYLATRVREVWSDVDASAQPFLIDGDVIELPIAAIADYTTSSRIGELFDVADVRLKSAPEKDVFVTIALHQETADEFAPIVRDAVRASQRKLGAGIFLFTTIEKAAYIAHH